MLGNQPRYQARPVARSNLSRGGPIQPVDYIWQSVWPYRISTIIGGLIMLFAFIVFVLEIALLGKYNTVAISNITSTRDRIQVIRKVF
jgi:hypothetical protein